MNLFGGFMTRLTRSMRAVREAAKLTGMFLYAILVIAGTPTAWDRR